MSLDVEVAASGWGKGESRKLEEYMELVHQDGTDVSDGEEEEEEEGSEAGESQASDDIAGPSPESEEDVPTEEDEGLTRKSDEDEVPQIRRKKKVPELTHDQLTAMVTSKLERTRLSNQRKHHSKKSVKSVGKQKGSKVKTDQKQLTSMEF